MIRSLCIAALAAMLATAAPADEPAPVVAVIAHPVADYPSWRKAYDELLPVREAAGLIGAQVLRDPDDPNMVILIHEFETLEGARKLMASPDIKAAMQRAGVTAPPVVTLGIAAD